MDFGLLPPEVNSGLMYTGPGSGPMLAAAAGWDSVAAELESAASGYSSSVSELIGSSWFGPSSMAMTAAATPYVAWLHTSAAAAGRAAVQAYSAVAAYEAAFAMTVPPPVIAANRLLKTALIATNFFGQNTPAIAATEAHYLAMWAQDAAAMYGYAVASSSASTLTSFSEAPQTTNSDGQAAQTRSVAQSTANTTTTRTQSLAQLSTANPTQPAQSGTEIVGPGTYGPGDYYDAAGGTFVVEQGGTLIIGDTDTLIVEQGATLTVGPGATYEVSGFNTFVVIGPGANVALGPSSQMLIGVGGIGAQVNIGAGSTLALGQGAEVSLANGTMTITSSTVSVAQFLGTTGTATGTVVVNGGVITTTGAAQASGVTAIPLGGGAATAAVAPPTGLVASPGLAGTSAIQPQLNADLLLDWVQTMPGAEVAADLTGAVG